jgi:hypothetical protein
LKVVRGGTVLFNPAAQSKSELFMRRCKGAILVSAPQELAMRYVVRKTTKRWMVWDGWAGKVALIDGHPATGLSAETANTMAREANGLDAALESLHRQKAPKHDPDERPGGAPCQDATGLNRQGLGFNLDRLGST